MLTLPFELCARLAYDGKLLGAVCRIFVDTVLGLVNVRGGSVGGPLERRMGPARATRGSWGEAGPSFTPRDGPSVLVRLGTGPILRVANTGDRTQVFHGHRSRTDADRESRVYVPCLAGVGVA